jgi:capsid portal protein
VRKKSVKPKSQVKTSSNSKDNVYEFGVFNLAVPQNISEPKNIKTLSTKYVPFGDDNLFPQYLAELKRKSSTNRSVLAQKTIFTSGAKFVCNNPELERFVEDVNADHESLRDVFKKLADDYYTFGNSYMECVIYDGGINLYHLDATKVRISKTNKEIYINSDWCRYWDNDEKITRLPIYPRVAHNKFVVHFKDYEPTFNFYGLPDYVAALEHIAVDFEIGKWNHTKFKNGFQPSAIVEINGDMGEEEAKKLVKEAQKKFVGEGNNGKIMFIVKNGDTTPANIQVIKDDQEGSWLDLQRVTDQNIITAHRWQPSLSGIVSSGKMNNTGSEIRIAYDLAMTTVIKDTSELLLNGIRKVLYNELGFDPKDLKIHYEPPVSYANEIDVKTVLTINEQRRMLDEDLPMLENGDMFIADREVIITDDNEIDEQENYELEDEEDYDETIIKE